MLDQDGAHAHTAATPAARSDDDARPQTPVSAEAAEDSGADAAADGERDAAAEAWAERWEAEQWAAQRAADADAGAHAAGVPHQRGRRARDAAALPPDALQRLCQAGGGPAGSVDGFWKDSAGVPRGACTACGIAACKAFIPFAPGTPLPTLPKERILTLLAAEPRARCACCGCACGAHETAAAASARQRAEADAARRAAARLETERMQRKRCALPAYYCVRPMR